LKRDALHPHTTILLVGHGRAGKDSIGDYLKKRHGFARAAFARPLYDAIQPLYGLDALQLLTADKEAVVPSRGRSIRQLVQHLGDHVRAECGEEILIKRLIERCMARGEWMQCDLVITDGRTDREIEWARSQGAAVWWVRRPGAPAVLPHSTEAIAWLHSKHHQPGDATFVNDGTLEQLYEAVDAALATMGFEVRA
jgi:hypothetical protein